MSKWVSTRIRVHTYTLLTYTYVCVQCNSVHSERAREEEPNTLSHKRSWRRNTEVHLVSLLVVRLKRDSELIKQFNGNFSIRMKIGHWPTTSIWFSATHMEALYMRRQYEERTSVERLGMRVISTCYMYMCYCNTHFCWMKKKIMWKVMNCNVYSDG